MRKSSLRFRLHLGIVMIVSLSLLPILGTPNLSQKARATTVADCSQSVTGSLTISTTVSGADCVIRFTAGTGTWRIPDGIYQFRVVVVGGGGGGSADAGGGGGGGSVYEGNITLTSDAIDTASVTIGDKGLPSVHTAIPFADVRPQVNDFLITRNHTTDSNGDGRVDGKGGFSQLQFRRNGIASESVTITSEGGNPGVYGSRSSAVSGGSGGASPTVTDNSSVLATTAIVTNGGSNGGPGVAFDSAGSPASGGVNGISTTFGTFGGGGGGGASINGNQNFLGASGGSGGGGSGAGGCCLSSIYVSNFPTVGTANTGGGGGSGAAHGDVALYTVGSETNRSRNGRSGGLGIVIIRYTPDITPPSLSTATLQSSGNQIQLAYSETLSAIAPNPARFRVNDSGTATLTPTAASFADSRTITLTLSGTIAKARTVTVTYETSTATGGALIEDAAFNDAAPITNTSVTNNSSILNVLPTPTSLTALNVDTSSANFSFSSTPNAWNNWHKLLIYDSATSTLVYGGGTYFFSGSKVTGLSPATQYSVTVRAVGDGITYESSTTTSPIYFTTLIRKPVISSQPASLSRTAGQSATFSVSATSPDTGTLTYQWQKNGANIFGETRTTLSFASVLTSDSATYSVIVTNSKNGVSDSATSTSVTLNVASALSITTPLSGLTAVVDSAYTLSLVSSGGSGAKMFALATGSLPTGLSLTSSTGIISGTPRVAGSNSLSIRVTDVNSAMDTTSVFTLSVSAANQTITLGVLSDRVFGSGNFTLSASDTTTSGLPIAYASSTLSTCTLSGSDSRTVTLVAVGTCTITANQAGNANYNPAPQVQQSFTITKAQPLFNTWTAITKTYGDAPSPITAPTLTSVVSGTLTYTSSDVSVVSISGVTLTVEGGGTVTITALFTPSDTSNYETATTTTTITVDRASQVSLSVTSTTATYGENLTVVTIGGSGSGSVTLTKVSGNCTVSGITLTPTSTGSCTITATKASDDNYLAETSTVTTITITTGSATATISFSSTSFIFGITNPITVTTSVAGVVRFSANGKLIKNCKARATTLTGPFTATCSYRPDTRRPLTIRAVLTPTDNRFATRTSTSGTFLVGRRTGARG